MLGPLGLLESTLETTTMTNSAAKSNRLAYRLSELSPMLGVSIKTLDRMRKNSSFPPPDQTAGRILLWRVETVEAWLSREWQANDSKSNHTAHSSRMRPARLGV